MDLDEFFNRLFGDHFNDDDDQFSKDFNKNPFKDPKDFKSESGEDEHGKWETKKWKDENGSEFSTFSYQSKNMDHLMSEARGRSEDDVKYLKQKLNSLIENEQYEKAAEMRDRIKLLEESESKK